MPVHLRSCAAPGRPVPATLGAGFGPGPSQLPSSAYSGWPVLPRVIRTEGTPSSGSPRQGVPPHITHGPSPSNAPHPQVATTRNRWTALLLAVLYKRQLRPEGGQLAGLLDSAREKAAELGAASGGPRSRRADSQDQGMNRAQGWS